jgi:DNA-binding PadR family transcriptional regulator
MATPILGSLEQVVLLAILRLGDEALALAVIREIDTQAGRRVSRGALYKTIERLADKGLVEWTVEDGPPERGGHPRRRFRVTAYGVAALRLARDTLQRLWAGLDDEVGRKRP